MSLFVSDGRGHVTSDGVAGAAWEPCQGAFYLWEISDASVSVMSRAKKSHKMWIICRYSEFLKYDSDFYIRSRSFSVLVE